LSLKEVLIIGIIWHDLEGEVPFEIKDNKFISFVDDSIKVVGSLALEHINIKSTSKEIIRDRIYYSDIGQCTFANTKLVIYNNMFIQHYNLNTNEITHYNVIKGIDLKQASIIRVGVAYYYDYIYTIFFNRLTGVFYLSDSSNTLAKRKFKIDIPIKTFIAGDTIEFKSACQVLTESKGNMYIKSYSQGYIIDSKSLTILEVI